MAENISVPLTSPDLSQKLFTQARTALKRQEFDKAIDILHRILSVDPKFIQVRFALGEAYLRLKKYDQATYHFKLVLAQNIPPQIARIIRKHLSFINRQKIWQISYGGNITPQSNANGGSHESVVLIGGIPFKLNESSLAQSGLSINANGAVVIAPQLNGDIYGHFKLYASGNYLPSSKQLNFNVGGEAGLSLKQKTNHYSLGLGYKKQFFDRAPYSDTLELWGRWQKLLTNNLNWSGQAVIAKTDFENLTGNEYDFTLSQSLNYEHDANIGFNLASTLSYTRSRSQKNDKANVGLTVTTRHSLPHYFTINPHVTAGYDHYFQKNGIFNKKRKNLKFGTGLKITNSKFKILDFAPYIQYNFEYKHSNISLYSTQNHSVSLGLTAKF
ncbi:MAG: DUF560 domain-containing protein [Rhizobiales bacterium]|nr:DUF560 domain-containing protein [Hyphomicrobiales bacterium]